MKIHFRLRQTFDLITLYILDYKKTIINNISWDDMEWNVTGNVESGNVDSEKELCVR